jgi:hypothetical protein
LVYPNESFFKECTLQPEREQTAGGEGSLWKRPGYDANGEKRHVGIIMGLKVTADLNSAAPQPSRRLVEP